jgi:hypothetical protein
MTTLATVQARLAMYRAAEAKILAGQEYTISDGVIQRRMRRADLVTVRDAITALEAQEAALQAAAAPTYRRVVYLR